MNVVLFVAAAGGGDRDPPTVVGDGIPADTILEVRQQRCGVLTRCAAKELADPVVPIKVVEIAKGFNSNAALFRYARDKGNKRADMYEVGLFKEMVAKSGEDLFFTINIPQEAVVIPETMDAIRAALSLQTDGAEAVALTNKYLGME